MPIAERDYDRQALPKVDLRRPLDYSQPSNKTAIVVGALDKGIQAGIQGYQTYARHKQANFNKEVSQKKDAILDEYGNVLLNATDEQLADQSWLATQGEDIGVKFLGGGRNAKDFGRDLPLVMQNQVREQTNSRLRGVIRQNRKEFKTTMSEWLKEGADKDVDITSTLYKDFLQKGGAKSSPLIKSLERLYPDTHKKRLAMIAVRESGKIAIEQGDTDALALSIRLSKRLVEKGVLNEGQVDKLRSDWARRSKIIREQRNEINLAQAAAEREQSHQLLNGIADAMARGDGKTAGDLTREAVLLAGTPDGKSKVIEFASRHRVFRDISYFREVGAQWAAKKISGDQAIAQVLRIADQRGTDPALFERRFKVFREMIKGKGGASRDELRSIKGAYDSPGMTDKETENAVNSAYSRSRAKATAYFNANHEGLGFKNLSAEGRQAWLSDNSRRLGELELVARMTGIDYEDLLDSWFAKEPKVVNPLSGSRVTSAYAALKSTAGFKARTRMAVERRDLRVYKRLLKNWQRSFYERENAKATENTEGRTPQSEEQRKKFRFIPDPLPPWNQLGVDTP